MMVNSREKRNRQTDIQPSTLSDAQDKRSFSQRKEKN